LKLSSVLSFEANLLALALVSHYVCIYHFTGLEVHFPGSRTPPSLRQRLGLPPLCAFSLWFYDRSARLNSFFTYVKYTSLPMVTFGEVDWSGWSGGYWAGWLGWPVPVQHSTQECLRSEEHTSELQSHLNLVCRLLLEQKIHSRRYRLSTYPRSSRNVLSSCSRTA